MKFSLYFLSLMMLLSCSKAPNHLGLPFSLPDEHPLTVSEALKPANYDRPIRVEGECYRVCQTEGCWLIVTDGTSKMRVTIKNKDFAAPMDLGSKKIILEGSVQEMLSSEDEAREYAENAGRSEAETNAISGDQRVPMLVATALEFK
ncbi:MAG: DUF4920 domain-containing protein [Candidatus Kapaibacterium sp.]